MEQYFTQLVKIYNTLLLVSTKGEDTIIMGQCLTSLNDLLKQIQMSPITSNNADVK